MFISLKKVKKEMKKASYIIEFLSSSIFDYDVELKKVTEDLEKQEIKNEKLVKKQKELEKEIVRMKNEWKIKVDLIYECKKLRTRILNQSFQIKDELELELYKLVVISGLTPTKAIKLLTESKGSRSSLWRRHKNLKAKGFYIKSDLF